MRQAVRRNPPSGVSFMRSAGYEPASFTSTDGCFAVAGNFEHKFRHILRGTEVVFDQTEGVNLLRRPGYRHPLDWASGAPPLPRISPGGYRPAAPPHSYKPRWGRCPL